MSDKAARPFLPFSTGPKNQLRQKVRGGGAPPRESAATHGQNLIQQVEAFQRVIDEQASQRAMDLPDLPDDVQVIVEAKKLLPDQVRSLGLTPIEEREEGMLVTVTPDVTLPLLVSKAESYISERTDSGNPRFGGVMAPIEQIRPANRDDKAGEQLAARLEDERFDLDDALLVDVELAGGNNEAGSRNRQEFNNYVSGIGLESTPYQVETVTAAGNFIVEADYSLHRVRLPGRAILDLLDDSRANWILSIELALETISRTTALPDEVRADTPTLPQLPQHAPRVVIIDSGIAAEHPFFQDGPGRSIIGRQQNFIVDQITAPPTDDVPTGHGTAIASLVAFGTLAERPSANQQSVEPAFWIENAKVLNPSANGALGALEFPPNQFPKVLMREIVGAFHNPMPQQCKIFVFAAGTDPHPHHTIANWADEIDMLSAQNDLLFVLATGDLSLEAIRAALTEGESYPDYLLADEARLVNPGQAYHGLTVGAVTPETAAPISPLRDEHTLAPAHFPAPFTRNGQPHHGGLVKPDVVEVGGNLSQKGAELVGSPETAVIVANRDFAMGEAEQPLAFHYGSGVAAAKVAHLAGRIQAQYPQASANLIRALIVNAAQWPRGLLEMVTANGNAMMAKEDKQKLLRLCGYGVPQLDKALSANSHCMVFVTEDKFTWVVEEKNKSGRYPAKVSFFSVKLEPDDIFNLPPATKVRVSITLAYNPPVRKTQRRRYQAVDLRWNLKRSAEDSEDFQTRWMAEINGEDDETESPPPSEGPRLKPWPWELKPVLNPGGKVRRGSLIRDWFDVYIHDLPHTLELVVVAMVAPWRKPPEPLTQNFALVVSIETLEGDVALYDSVRVHMNGEAE